jgi:hypothetical protein
VWGGLFPRGEGGYTVGVCTMWEPVPPALGHNLVCLVCDTTLNGDKALASHNFIHSMSCGQAYSISTMGAPLRGAARVSLLPWMPREGTSMICPVHYIPVSFVPV